MGRILPVVTVREFSGRITCYAEPNGQVGPPADDGVLSAELAFGRPAHVRGHRYVINPVFNQ